MSLKPPKSTTTWWSMRMLVSFSTVLMVQAAPASENAELNIASVCAATTVPSGRLQLGIGTIVSRGMLTITALCRSAARCSRIVVSERRPATFGFSAAFPDRSSEPSSRMFSGSWGASGTSTLVGRSPPIRLSTFSWVMFPFSFW